MNDKPFTVIQGGASPRSPESIEARRRTTIEGGRGVLTALDEADQRAELARARRDGEVVFVTATVQQVAPPPVSREEQVKKYFRWASWACPNGLPPGWKEGERR